MEAGAFPEGAEAQQSEAFQVGDSAWFWLALFGTVAVVGLVVVNHKYSARQMRLELRYQNRLDTQARREAVQAGEPVTEERTTQPISARAPQPRAQLEPLVALFGLIAVVGYVGLGMAWRKHTAEQAAVIARREANEYDHAVDH